MFTATVVLAITPGPGPGIGGRLRHGRAGDRAAAKRGARLRDAGEELATSGVQALERGAGASGGLVHGRSSWLIFGLN